MRFRAPMAPVLAFLLGGAPRAVHAADSAPASSAPTAEATADARRHFKLGIKLYQDTNYPGALAEFEAAYAAKPGPSSLQNVALCQKALFRYREAAATLEQLLKSHGSELSEGETKAVTDAIGELHGLVGSLVVNVEPSEAKVSVDGRALTLAELRAGVEMNVGEHTLVADLQGYARLSRVVRVASGKIPLSVELKLKATDGFLNVVASDPRAAIAIDGTTRAFHEWRGSVKPDSDHLIQVFREGYESFETTVSVAVGKTLEVRAELGPHIDSDPEAPLEKSDSMPAPPPPRVPRGYYGLLTLGVLAVGRHPLQLSATRAESTVGAIGLRAGYRISAPIAAEFMLDFGKLDVKNAKTEVPAGEDVAAPRHYSLAAFRFGPNLRLMTTGKKLRFTSAIGAGAVYHKLVLDPVALDPSLTGGTAKGFDPYFLLELGVQWSVKRFLLGAQLIASIDGASSLNAHNLEGANKAFGDSNTLPLLGIGIHGGYSLW